MSNKASSLVRRLGALAPHMVQGSLSWTYRTCGKAGCRCHAGAKHGPDAFVTFRHPDRRPGAIYVPKGRERLRRALRRRAVDAATR